MLTIQRDYLESLASRSASEIENKKVKAIFMEDYLSNMLDQYSKLEEVKYPLTIKVPRSVEYMLRTGDVSPAKEITIEKPYLYEGNPIWTRSSLRGVSLGFGYLNGDKRYLSPYQLGDTSPKSGPHMVVGGMTSGGKSVFMNNIIFNILFSYSPFEVELTLIDAKISEAKRYYTTHHVPNVTTIGATSDTGYVISILQNVTTYMVKVNKLFSTVGTNDLATFRMKTGLSIPRKIIIVDEYQLQYENATQKESTQLTSLYNKICVAGRSAGIHIILCSQSFLSELKNKLFHSIPLRTCLTCVDSTSEGILGNKSASQGIPVGEVHFNFSTKQTLEDTMMFKVPFQNDKAFEIQGKFLESVAERMGHEFNVNFYDEESMLSKEIFNTLLDKYSRPDRIVMGTPSYIKSKEVDVFYNEHTFSDLENTLVFSPDGKDVREYAHMYASNFKRFDVSNTRCVYLVADKSLIDDVELPSYANRFDIAQSTDAAFVAFMGTVYRKNVMLTTDAEVFGGASLIDTDVVEVMKTKFGENSPVCSTLNFNRVSIYTKKLKDPAFLAMMGINENAAVTQALATLESLLGFSQDFINKKVDINNIPTHYFNIVGLDKLRGIGRASNYKSMETFKNVMFDAYNSKCCVIVYSTNIKELTSFKDSYGMVVTSNSKEHEMRMGIELPNELAPTLGCFVKPSTGYQVRFKRLNIYDRVVD